MSFVATPDILPPIALTDLATTTASRALVSSAGGVITPATTTSTEIGYVNGVTSAIQTQLDAKAASFSSAQVICDSPNGHGAVDTKIRRFTNSTTTGSDITYADSANNGASFTINTAGLYSISYSDLNSGGTSVTGISVNSAELTTNIVSITKANRILSTTGATGFLVSTSAVARLAANDVIRAHTNGGNDSTAEYAQFRIVRIG